MDWSSQLSKLEFVRSQCKTIAGAKHYKDYTMICCPFHRDANPSGRIFHSESTKNVGFFKCYGCGKTCGWNELAPEINCEPFDKKPVTRYVTPKEFNLENEAEEKKEKLIFSSLPKHKLWRDIKTDLLISIGCKICRIDYGFTQSDKFVYLPVIIDKETVGYTKGRMKKEKDKPSYINLKGSWVKTHGLFPFDYAISKLTETKTLVLVEGQRDALRLLQCGIPALCIMGTQNFSIDKARLLELHGVERVVIMLDGDDAGIEGTKKVAQLVKGVLEYKVVKLWRVKDSPYLTGKGEKYDPNNCPSWILKRLKEKWL